MPRRLFALPFALLPLLGCESDDGQVYDADTHAHDDEHAHAAADHAEIGPHGGQIIELTADHSLHGEMVLDADDPARNRFYLLGGDLKTPVKAERVALFLDDHETGEETNIELAEIGGDGNEDEHAWSFRDMMVPGDDDHFAGEIKVVVDGEEYEGSFGGDHDHAGHDHGDHDHDHDGHDHGGEDHDAYDDDSDGDEI